MSVRRGILTGVLLVAGGAVVAADDKLPDEVFLEYLGSWEESDEDWLMFEKESKKEAKQEERKRDDSDKDAKVDESAETIDES
jgi:hypothetical protein